MIFICTEMKVKRYLKEYRAFFCTHFPQGDPTGRNHTWTGRLRATARKVFNFGPFIFEENEITLTVNSFRYKDMIIDFLGQKLKDEKSTWLTYGSSETGCCSCGPSFYGYSSSVVHWVGDRTVWWSAIHRANLKAMSWIRLQ